MCWEPNSNVFRFQMSSPMVPNQANVDKQEQYLYLDDLLDTIPLLAAIRLVEATSISAVCRSVPRCAMTVKVRRCIRVRNRYRSLPESYRRCDLQYGVKPTLDMLCASQPKHDQMLDCALDCDAKIPRTWPSCNTDGTNSAEHVHRET